MNQLLKNIAICSFSAIPLVTLAESNTVFGDFRYSFNNIDNGKGGTISANDNATRLGFKGDMGDKKGLTAFYHLQFGANVEGADDAFQQRFFFAGIRGDFGELVIGRTSTPYKMAGLRIDPFYDTTAGNGFGGANFGLSPTTNLWSDNTIAYSSPKLGNFTLNASTYLDDSNANQHDINLGVQYKQDGFTGGIQYMSIGDTAVIANSIADSTAIRVHTSYKMEKLNVGVSVESIDINNPDSQQFGYLSVTYQATNDIKWAASYGSASNISAAADGTETTFGVFYKLLDKTTVYGLYSSKSSTDYSPPTSSVNPTKQLGLFDKDVLSIVVSHKFSFGL